MLSAKPMSLAAGTRVGPYEILAPLGVGGMGAVYRARDTRLGRTVAIKVLIDTLAANPQFRERFDREARAISQLSHPNICTVHDVGEHAGSAFLVMEILEGETLADRLRRSAAGRLPYADALAIAIQIADALTAAHRAGIVHRDLKPANVMLTKAGAKLLDFGLAKTQASPVIPAGVSRMETTPPQAVTIAGHDPGNHAVHGAGAGRGQRRGRTDGHLRVRRGALRNAHGTEGF